MNVGDKEYRVVQVGRDNFEVELVECVMRETQKLIAKVTSKQVAKYIAQALNEAEGL